MRALYTLLIFFYGFVLRIAALFNPKAALWVNGRKNLLEKIRIALQDNKKPLIWMHAASLGEFEQGRPLIEAIKEKHPNYAILLTFFSPSGYEVRKNFELADFVFYLPLDTAKNARFLLECAPIKLAIFIKYEYWYNYMAALNKNRIPLVFISAILRPDQIFFRKYGTWFLNHLRKVEWLFVQTQESLSLLQKKGIKKTSFSGDTRFDRVAAITLNAKTNDIIDRFKGQNKLLVLGSSWPEEEALLYPLLEKFPELKIVIAPHQIDRKHLKEIERKSMDKALFYSHANIENVLPKQVLIIDNFGLLSSIYRYADFTFIGGGFGVGIHNTLEAATFGMPIFIGPNYQKFQEAKDLVALGAIEIIEDSFSLEKELHHLIAFSEKAQEKGQIAREYVKSKTGATQHILSHLEQNKLL